VGGVTQSVDPSGEVRAQVMYFKHAAPQFMIGGRTAWQPGKKKLRSLEDAGHFVDPTTGVAADTTAPSKAELHAAIAEVVALPGSAYTALRQRLRRTLAKRRWAPHGFGRGGGVRPLPRPLRDTLMARFGVVADERFAAVLNGITKARRQRYNAAYQARPHDDATVVA
jgi:hypothetical protein